MTTFVNGPVVKQALLLVISRCSNVVLRCLKDDRSFQGPKFDRPPVHDKIGVQGGSKFILFRNYDQPAFRADGYGVLGRTKVNNYCYVFMF